jgi:acyl-coenzyme A thioesterase PaaI-like protein
VLIGTGHVVARGGSIAFLAGELATEHGELIATATATARIVKIEALPQPVDSR